jgi:hypothetical protein
MAQQPSAGSGSRQQLIQEICAEWNQAEGEMKLAEQIAHALVMPSVNELRYAGRRIIDACMLEGDPNAQDRVHGLLEAARFFCLRAPTTLSTRA